MEDGRRKECFGRRGYQYSVQPGTFPSSFFLNLQGTCGISDKAFSHGGTD